jgi:hypothetical protein
MLHRYVTGSEVNLGSVTHLQILVLGPGAEAGEATQAGRTGTSGEVTLRERTGTWDGSMEVT